MQVVECNLLRDFMVTVKVWKLILLSAIKLGNPEWMQDFKTERKKNICHIPNGHHLSLRMLALFMLEDL